MSRIQVLNFDIRVSFTESFASSNNLFGGIKNGDLAAAVSEVFSGRKTVFVDLGDGEGVLARAKNIHFFKVEPLLSRRQLFGFEFEMVPILTNLVSTEVVFEILERHPEAAVIFGSMPSFLFQFIRPQLGRITPVACPFEATPGISEFDELNRVAISVVSLKYRNQSI